MLHEVNLAPSVLTALTRIVRVQFRLLDYAARHRKLDQQACAEHVALALGLGDEGQAVADWVWDAAESRLRPLQAFARHRVERDKRVWICPRRREAIRLLWGVPPELTPTARARDLPAWQKGGAEFLRGFYTAFSTERGFPGEILGQPGLNFGRHDFLQAFSSANDGLYVCAVCDEARVGTRHGGGLRATIDHFFPESTYPHLSVHPYNLIPVCHSCNSLIKGATDPLKDGRRLADIVLPYRPPALARSTYLAVEFDSPRMFTMRPIRDRSSADRVANFEWVSKIPGRWNDSRATDEIGETAFRRLRQYLSAQPELLNERDVTGLLRKLDEFLGIMRDENLGRDPFSFPMKWLLAHIAHRAHEDETMAAPLLAELRDELVPTRLYERETSGAELREILRAEREP